MIHLEQGLDRWLDLIANKNWIRKTKPEQKEIWEANKDSSTLMRLVIHAQLYGDMIVSHYWQNTLAATYCRYLEISALKLNEFCNHKNIPFSFNREYIERATRLADRLHDKGPIIIPKDKTVYDTDPLLVPFLPHIKEVEGEVTFPIIERDFGRNYSRIIANLKENASGNKQAIQKVKLILDDARNSGSSSAIGNEAKEAIDLYGDSLTKKKELYKLLKERKMKLPEGLHEHAPLASILECALFEKKYNNRTFNPFLFSEEFVDEYLLRGNDEDVSPAREKEIEKIASQQVYGQEFMALQKEVNPEVKE